MRTPAQASLPADTATALARMADALAWPLLVLDRSGRLQHANKAARMVLATGSPFRLTKGSRRVEPAAALDRAGFAQALQSAFAVGGAARAWPAGPGHLLAVLQRIDAAVPVVFLALPSPEPWQPDVRIYAMSLGLTPAETRVVRELAQGWRAPQVAAALGLAVSTVRSHIASMRRKSGHASTAELLMALSRLPPGVLTHEDGK